MEFVVGRKTSPANHTVDLEVVGAEAMSREHVRVTYQSGDTGLVTDLSTNGTYVERGQPERLSVNSEVGLDETLYFGSLDTCYTLRQLIALYQQQSGKQGQDSDKATQLISGYDQLPENMSPNTSSSPDLEKTAIKRIFRDPITGEVIKK